MKILFIVPDINPTRGGIQSYLHRFVSTVDEVTDTKHTVISRKNALSLISPIELLVFISRIFIDVLFNKPDFIIVGHIHYGPVVQLIEKLFGIKYWIITYGMEVWDLHKKSEMNALKKSSKVITISEFTRDKITDSTGIDSSKISLVPCAVNDSRFSPDNTDDSIRANLKIPKDAKVLLTVCRLESQEMFHSYDAVIDALVEIGHDAKDVHYILVGKGDDRARVENKINSLGISDRIHLVGYVDDEILPYYYTASDIFIMPSILEGFGIVYLEALVSGVPVIAGDRDGSKEAVFDERLGQLVDPYNANEVAQAIIQMVASLNQGHYRAEVIRKLVLERFSLSAYKSTVQELIG